MSEREVCIFCQSSEQFDQFIQCTNSNCKKNYHMSCVYPPIPRCTSRKNTKRAWVCSHCPATIIHTPAPKPEPCHPVKKPKLEYTFTSFRTIGYISHTKPKLDTKSKTHANMRQKQHINSSTSTTTSNTNNANTHNSPRKQQRSQRASNRSHSQKRSQSWGSTGNSASASSPNLPRKQLRLARSLIHSFGVFAGEFFSRDTHIIEYKGERIRAAVADRREPVYEERGLGEYMFRISSESIIDATFMGNLARFVNHSCEPNCYTKIVRGRIIICALRNIEEGEELAYDYKFPLEEVKIPCFCGSKRCRRFMN